MVLDYEDQRREYFEEQLRIATKSLDWWSRHYPGKRYDHTHIHERCSKLGMRINFLQDALNALSKESVKKSSCKK